MRFRDTHHPINGWACKRRYFGSSISIERRVPRVHAGRADGLDPVLRQFGGGEAAAAFLESA